MVAVKPSSSSSFQDDLLGDLFDKIPDPPPKIRDVDVKQVVVNPLSCAMIDVGDHTSANIDRMIECLQDIKSIKSNLDETRKRIERELESMCDKSKAKNTHHIIGEKYDLVLECPSRSFNNAGCKKLWSELSEEVNKAVSQGDMDTANKIAALRNKFLRITEVAVNLKDFKLYEGADVVPPEYDELFKKIARLEDTSNWPSFKLPEKGTDLGSSPIVVQKIE